eukprot:jgi/Tetstr1/439882/TSEL_028290.t1
MATGLPGFENIGAWEQHGYCYRALQTLKHLRHLARRGDWMISLDLQNDYYCLGIREEDRDSNYHDELCLLSRLGMGYWEPTQVGEHLAIELDLRKGKFCAPPEIQTTPAQEARGMLGCAASNRRWLPVRQLASFVGKAQLMYLTFAPTRFVLRELLCVLATRQAGAVA